MIHIMKTVSTCFAVLHQFRSIRQPVSWSVLQSLVVPLVLLSLDYHPVVPIQAAPVSDELRCPAGVFIVEVWPHHCSFINYIGWKLLNRFSKSSRFWLSNAAPMYLIDELFQPTDLGIRSRWQTASTSSLPVTAVNHRQLSFSNCRCWYLKRSAVRCHIHTISASFL